MAKRKPVKRTLDERRMLVKNGIPESEWPEKNICGAQKKRGSICKHPPGWGTHHPGTGRCKLHGGSVKGGLFTDVVGDSLQRQLERLEEDPRVFDIREQIKLQVSLQIEALHRLRKKPKALARNADRFVEICEKISRNIERLKKVEEGEHYTIHIEALDRILAIWARILEDELGDKDLVERVGRRFQSFQVGDIARYMSSPDKVARATPHKAARERWKSRLN